MKALTKIAVTVLIFLPFWTPVKAGSIDLTPSFDLRILQWYPDTPLFGDGYLSVFNSGNNIQHSLLQFDLGSIPTGATISNAILTLHVSGYTQMQGTHSDVYAVARPWGSTATWNSAASGSPWITPGGDVTGTVYAVNSEVIYNNSAPVSWDVTGLVSAWTGGSLQNYGLLLLGSPGDGLHFYPSNSGTDRSPSLTVTYSTGNPGAIVPDSGSSLILILGCFTVLLSLRRFIR